jgi:hypothetical protein
MRVSLRVALCLSFIAPPSTLYAQDYVALDAYTCSEFLNDVKQPANGARLLRSLMMISWATGFASAYQAKTPRADPRAIQLTAAVIGKECRQKPSQTVVQATVAAIANFVAAASPRYPNQHHTGQVSKRLSHSHRVRQRQ